MKVIALVANIKYNLQKAEHYARIINKKKRINKSARGCLNVDLVRNKDRKDK